MLLGRWAQSLVSLERSLLNELEVLPVQSVPIAANTEQRPACREAKSQAGEIGTPSSRAGTLQQEEPASFEGFLF